MENLDNYVDAYTTKFKFYEENILYLTRYSEIMMESIVQNQYNSILSLGIGHEVVSKSLASLYGNQITQHHIIDGSEKLVNEFQKQSFEGVRTVELTYFENFSTARQFDCIEMGFVLEHVDDPGLILRHFKPFLKHGGSVYIAVPNARSLHRLIGHHAGLLADMYELSSADHQLGHKRYFDLDSISGLVKAAGYTIHASYGLMLKPITGSQMKQVGWNENIMKALMVVGDDFPAIANCIYLEAKPMS